MSIKQPKLPFLPEGFDSWISFILESKENYNTNIPTLVKDGFAPTNVTELAKAEFNALCKELRRLENYIDRPLIKAAYDLFEAAVSAENALTDYILRIEKQGATLGYGHSVLAQVRAAIARANGGSS